MLRPRAARAAPMPFRLVFRVASRVRALLAELAALVARTAGRPRRPRSGAGSWRRAAG